MPNILFPNEWLDINDKLTSDNEQYQLILQPDGNLVLYRQGYPHGLWSSSTKDAIRAIMKSDGNFVLYGYRDQPLWASGTSGANGSFLVLQNDGNLVIYRPNIQEWTSDTASSMAASDKSFTRIFAPKYLS
ncbi:hypothetical protein [Nitrosovibrio sp. Nv6]|uniref:hypothetical protein n=1 Tax=Nitrosovibrio sp. Nv6 TaxID=1855340 RepID=UPI0008AE4569|nr:hypothetical protein [Nitrosovibrio sp. Nv6]SEP27882.1 D-mannose binding lectin [Nitrosovibrio sp. Nv6]